MTFALRHGDRSDARYRDAFKGLIRRGYVEHIADQRFRWRAMPSCGRGSCGKRSENPPPAPTPLCLSGSGSASPWPSPTRSARA